MLIAYTVSEKLLLGICAVLIFLIGFFSKSIANLFRKPIASTSAGDWEIIMGDEEKFFTHDKTEALATIVRRIEDLPSGRILLSEDVGESSWVSRKIFAMNPRDIRMRFAVEWYEQTSSLTFFDDAVSEYHVLNQDSNFQPDKKSRTNVSHGEGFPHPISQCIRISESIEAITAYFDSQTMPSACKYHYVK